VFKHKVGQLWAQTQSRANLGSNIK